MGLTIAAQAQAADCRTIDGVTVPNGQPILLHFKNQPRTQIGPNYFCGLVSRVRTCVEGRFSEAPRDCSQFDSGGCVDGWLDMMPDNAFEFAQCED